MYALALDGKKRQCAVGASNAGHALWSGIASEAHAAEVAKMGANGTQRVTALEQWLHRYTELLATKRGLATALHSGDPAYDGLQDYFFDRPDIAADFTLESFWATPA